ncbi:MAG: tetratricopeptide repeat protein [Campylobacterales bacterium]|nr:tetratricopeptide repeat protein [Campylobacterales bacterium]
MRFNFFKATSFLWVAPFLFAAEVSVFEAGNLRSATPYGLTQNEKLLLEKTQEMEKLSRDLANVRNEFNTIKEQMEGVRSVLDGTNTRVGRSDGDMRVLEGKITALESSLAQLTDQLLSLQAAQQENKTIQETNNERLRVVLGEMSSLIDSINNNYASKSALNALVERVDGMESKKTPPAPVASNSSALEAKPGAELMQEALNFFDAGSLDEAWARYDILVKKNYMPARSNYFLGEIAYKKQQWKTAIKHFKISIDLYDKADYIPRLLYHTAISFDKSGEPASAAPFYRALKTNYPDSKEAQASPNR